MNPSTIDTISSSISARKRASTVRRAQLSTTLEGGRSSRQARALQRRWAAGEITYAQFGAELDLLRPTTAPRLSA